MNAFGVLAFDSIQASKTKYLSYIGLLDSIKMHIEFLYMKISIKSQTHKAPSPTGSFHSKCCFPFKMLQMLNTFDHSIDACQMLCTLFGGVCCAEF